LVGMSRFKKTLISRALAKDLRLLLKFRAEELERLTLENTQLVITTNAKRSLTFSSILS